jgi:hypothetical protein
MSMRRHHIGLALVASVLSIVSAGCVATRTWTHELVAKQEVEIDERFEKVETGVRQHEERLDRVEVRVGQLDTGLSEARALLRPRCPSPRDRSRRRARRRRHPRRPGAR